VRDRPINLKLFTLKFPVTAIASILHRISGFILFLLIPFFLSMLQAIMFFPELFAEFYINKLFLGLIGVALLYHLFAGVRHLIMDCGYGETKEVARLSAYLVFILTISLTILLSYSLC